MCDRCYLQHLEEFIEYFCLTSAFFNVILYHQVNEAVKQGGDINFYFSVRSFLSQLSISARGSQFCFFASNTPFCGPVLLCRCWARRRGGVVEPPSSRLRGTVTARCLVRQCGAFVLLATLCVCVISWVVINSSPRYVPGRSFEHQVRTS